MCNPKTHYIMKQVIIRIVGPQLPVYDVAFGRIKDGHFVPAPIEEINDFLDPDTYQDYLTVSHLLGGQAFVTSDKLAPFIRCLSFGANSIMFYPNFIVFGYVEKEEDAEE